VSESETEEVVSSVRNQMQGLLMLAARGGETLASMRAQQRREAAALVQQDAAELANRLDAERRLALIDLRSIQHDNWWAGASVDAIVQRYSLARAWAAEDAEAATAARLIEVEVERRYGVDVAQLRAQQADAAVSAQPNAGVDLDGRTRREGPLDLGDPGLLDDLALAEALEDPLALYDTTERRRQTEQHALASGAEPAVVEAVVAADRANAQPVTAATIGRAPRSSKARGRGRSQQRTKDQGLSR